MRDNCADIFVENAKAAHQAAEYCAVWSDEVDCRQPPPLANLQGLHERMRDNAAVLPRFFRRDVRLSLPSFELLMAVLHELSVTPDHVYHMHLTWRDSLASTFRVFVSA
eukprot:1155820-Pelagomonas_calceolata.AAC.6